MVAASPSADDSAASKPAAPFGMTLKLLCSYGGKILPRHPDGRLRYVGGETRVLSVPRSTPFSELVAKMSELCGCPVSLRCQLPAGDLDALVSIISDEDLANLIEEYDRAAEPAAGLKLRAFLFPYRPKTPSPPGSIWSPPARRAAPAPSECLRHAIAAAASSTPAARLDKSAANIGFHKCCAPRSHSGGGSYLVHSGNHWQ